MSVLLWQIRNGLRVPERGAVSQLGGKARPWHKSLFVLKSLRLIAVAGRMGVEESEILRSFERRVTGIEIQTQVPGRR